MSVLRRDRYFYPPYYNDYLRYDGYYYPDRYLVHHPYYLSRGWPYYRHAPYPSYRLSLLEADIASRARASADRARSASPVKGSPEKSGKVEFEASASPQKSHKDAQQILTKIFRHVSTEESMIELRRQDLAMNAAFDCKAAFEAIRGEDKDVGIISDDLIRFLEHNEVENIDGSVVDAIVRDFDGTRDGALTIEEFKQMVLPAANNELRDLGEHRSVEGDLAVEPRTLLVKLLEREIEYQTQLNSLREQLEKVEDFSVSEMYERLAVYKHGIILESLNRFLTVNGFHTRLSDTDAILRRFDHNANQALDYAEFHELCTGQDISDKEEKEDKAVSDKDVKEEIEEVIEDKREEFVEMKRQDLDSDAEVKHQQEDSPEKRYRAQQEQNYGFLRILKTVLHSNGRIASYRDQLSKHTYFSASDLFYEFDRGNKGYLTLEDFDRGFASYFNPEKLEEKMSPSKSDRKDKKEKLQREEQKQSDSGSEVQLQDDMRSSLERFMILVGAKDGQLSYRQFMAAVASPYYQEPRYPIYGRSTVDAHSLANRQSAVQTLSTLCQEYVHADEAAAISRQDNCIDGEELFNKIDVYRTGRLHSGDLAHWLRTEVAFNVTPEQLAIVHNFLDNGGHYYIGKDAFCMAVTAVHEESEAHSDQYSVGEQQNE